MMSHSAMPSRVPEPLLPDGGPAGPIRIHTPPPRALTFAEQPTPPPSGIRPFAYLKYHWVMVLFLGGFLACLFAAAAWKLIPSKYTTSSMVRVFNVDPIMFSKEDPQGRNDFATYIKTQAAMIRSNFVLTAALRDPAVAALPMLREQTDPIRFLEEELKIEYQEGSEIIKISLSGEEARAIAMIVNSVQDAFFREVVQEEITGKRARLKNLEDSISKMQDEVKRMHGQIKPADGAVPEVETIPGLSAQIAASQLFHSKEALAKLESDIQSWESEKASLENRLKNITEEVPPPPPGYSESLENDLRMQALAKKIEKKKSVVDQLLFSNGGTTTPAVDGLRKEIADAQEERERFKRERLAEHQKAQQSVVEKKLKSDLERSQSLIMQLTTQKDKVQASVAEYAKMLGQIGQPGNTLPEFGWMEVKERIGIITAMLDKANLLRLEVNAPPRVRDFQRAAVPLKKEMKKQILGTIVAGLMGFGLVGLCVVLQEARVRRAMSLGDVQKSVLGPVVGVLPAREKGSNAVAATGESVEMARTQMLQQFSQPGGKIIAVSSALTEEGKTFLAWQLAESCARSGTRTLLIDFDLRAPALHASLNVNNERGLCEVMLAQVEFKDSIQVLPTGLMFIPAGTWVDEVRLGLTADRLEAFLNWLRPQFDYVILNTHPLLAVAETFLLCRNADGVLLSVERLESRLPLVARAHEKLAAVAHEGFGIVYQGASAEECLH